ncbi:MAG TPA: aquaporin family protein [Candidatus Alistipes faecigallinarum]|uniref:MIP/aquaporin family protein n=1 Tax=uncultured Alistipes sp. TaxID=538949 RepID=UPI001F900030|nr:MIP/aquaporin family protein [uncultured Alistipes sp.]HIY46418.1 aquaporin family protein [Candidatus Alistipes faecigallinarum]
MNDVFVKCLFEFIGTAILVLFGDGVVASNCLKKSKGENGGWVVITLAWGLAVMLGVFISGPYSGAHLNPAVTLGLAAAGTFSWSLVVPYIVAQMLGGFVGAVLVYAFYKDHYDATDDPAVKLGTFCTAPAIRNYGRNLFSEILGTFVLVFVILALSIQGNTPEVGMGALGAFPVAMLIVALGMSLGGTTGYAINPARDLAPRLAHAVLPIKGKGSNDWAYSWVPVVGPVIGGFLAAAGYCLIFC